MLNFNVLILYFNSIYVNNKNIVTSGQTFIFMILILPLHLIPLIFV
ncbi:hypothetical protein J2W57_001423 [Chryseobacterium ginsenosidimutans]|uniref:Uncharacterized protein n=1 Tax=Chryseobacterium geocarposphaerae TaxID=1416776 RepID=A0ABU1LDB9_9FLAO|nr:hypothetical protein [Chryseobacterium geocarposphaerae]MDR6698055.1 hypothetical protein [Chryseobacterium ginsenosidimutans]